MAIAPISGLSTYSPVADIQPMNYAVENTAGFSDVYASESTKQTGGVNSAAPVQYPNATVQEVEVDAVDPLEKQKQALQAASDFNNIAEQFSQNNTSYSNLGIGASYSMIGSGFDAYA